MQSFNENPICPKCKSKEITTKYSLGGVAVEHLYRECECEFAWWEYCADYVEPEGEIREEVKDLVDGAEKSVRDFSGINQP